MSAALAEPRALARALGMSATGSMSPRPMSASAERGRKVLRGGEHAEDAWEDERANDDDDAHDDEAPDDEAPDDEAPPADPAELDPQLERAESEGMVTEHAKVSATDPGPEPLPEPEPSEPEPDRGPGDPQWEEHDERD